MISFGVQREDPGEDYHLDKTWDIRGQHDLWAFLKVNLGFIEVKRKIHII